MWAIETARLTNSYGCIAPRSACIRADGAGVSDADNLEKFRPYLLVLASSHIPPGHGRWLDASDVVQQTLMEAHQNRGQYNGRRDSEQASWLRKMLLNNVVDAIRAATSRKRNVLLEKSLDRAVNDSFERAESWLAAEQTSPSQHAMREEQLLKMSQAITELPLDQRAAVILHHLQGFKLKEVAEHLGRTETAVAGLLSRGMKNLRRRISE